MNETTQRTYKATFILDLRESEDDSGAVLSELNEAIASLGGQTVDSEDLGVRDFVRAADDRFTKGHYLEIRFEVPPGSPSGLQENLRLDGRINRVFVEHAGS